MNTLMLLIALCPLTFCVEPTTHATIGWDEASGSDVAGYLMKTIQEGESDTLLGMVPNPVAIPCGDPDTGSIRRMEEFQVVVRAVDSTGQMGPQSEPSEPIRCMGANPDFNLDTLVNGLDFPPFLECFKAGVDVDSGLHSTHPDFYGCDLNLDGLVNGTDFGLFLQAWGGIVPFSCRDPHCE